MGIKPPCNQAASAENEKFFVFKLNLHTVLRDHQRMKISVSCFQGIGIKHRGPKKSSREYFTLCLCAMENFMPDITRVGADKYFDR